FLRSTSLLLTLNLSFLNHPATTAIYTLSLHDALPIWRVPGPEQVDHLARVGRGHRGGAPPRRPRPPAGQRAGARDLLRAANAGEDRKSTRLNSSHVKISYAVFCLKKKKKKARTRRTKT